MVATGTHEVAPGRLRPTERDRFLGLIDRAFGCPAPASLRTAFPTALAAENHDHHYVLREGEEILSAAAALRRRWRTSQGWLEVACLGCFATDPAHRGRGHSRRLQEWMLEELAAEGVELALLWTDEPRVYRRRGFEACGVETHARLSLPLEVRPEAGESLRPGGPDDAAALLRLYEQHPLRSARTLEDMRRYLAPEVSRTAILEREGRPVAYAALGKGLDFPGYVHDYAGSPRQVQVLWRALAEQGARAVLVPEGAEGYLRGAAETLPRWQRRSAWGRWLADGPTATPRWAAWGFDSA